MNEDDIRVSLAGARDSEDQRCVEIIELMLLVGRESETVGMIRSGMTAEQVRRKLLDDARGGAAGRGTRPQLQVVQGGPPGVGHAAQVAAFAARGMRVQ